MAQKRPLSVVTINVCFREDTKYTLATAMGREADRQG